MSAPKGFIVVGKKGSSPSPALSLEQKTQLLRKGNELFNQGKFEVAERIFVTLKYSDGLIRVGDVYLKKGEYVHAMKLYRSAPDAGRVERLGRQMATIVRQWMSESSGGGSPT